MLGYNAFGCAYSIIAKAKTPARPAAASAFGFVCVAAPVLLLPVEGAALFAPAARETDVAPDELGRAALVEAPLEAADVLVVLSEDCRAGEKEIT